MITDSTLIWSADEPFCISWFKITESHLGTQNGWLLFSFSFGFFFLFWTTFVFGRTESIFWNWVQQQFRTVWILEKYYWLISMVKGQRFTFRRRYFPDGSLIHSSIRHLKTAQLFSNINCIWRAKSFGLNWETWTIECSRLFFALLRVTYAIFIILAPAITAFFKFIYVALVECTNKRGCVFPMVIWPAFRIWQYRVNDHPCHAPQFNIF